MFSWYRNKLIKKIVLVLNEEVEELVEMEEFIKFYTLLRRSKVALNILKYFLDILYILC